MSPPVCLFRTDTMYEASSSHSQFQMAVTAACSAPDDGAECTFSVNRSIVFRVWFSSRKTRAGIAEIRAIGISARQSLPRQPERACAGTGGPQAESSVAVMQDFDADTTERVHAMGTELNMGF